MVRVLLLHCCRGAYSALPVLTNLCRQCNLNSLHLRLHNLCKLCVSTAFKMTHMVQLVSVAIVRPVLLGLSLNLTGNA
ncbi:hypothetical protein EV702DRAFT_452747 [Suillus placidus]|uniref:Secreted protein n=1 Tax=Suillus placidus TaxID=48579 RepID=A0A9P7D0Q2_9AGAM|nr:hypothetical protein EV702DRAFT_452747 [Suillus placidus]